MLVADCNISSVIALFGLPTEQPGTEGHTSLPYAYYAVYEMKLGYVLTELRVRATLQVPDRGMSAMCRCGWVEFRLTCCFRKTHGSSNMIMGTRGRQKCGSFSTSGTGKSMSLPVGLLEVQRAVCQFVMTAIFLKLSRQEF